MSDTPLFASLTRTPTDWRIRAAAVLALRDRVGDRVALKALMDALDDPSPHVAEAAAVELARSRPALQSVKAELLRWIGENDDRWQASSQLLSGLAPLGEGPLILAWLDAVPLDRVAARVAGLEALSLVPGDDYLDRLFEEASGTEDRVVAAAYRGLAGHWGGDRADPDQLSRYETAFVNGLSHPHPTVVGTAARGLTDPLLLDRGSARALEMALLDRDPTDASDAPATAALVSALAQTRDEAWVPLLTRYLDHPHRSVRVAAREAVQSLTLETPAPPPRPSIAPESSMQWDRFPDERPRIVMETEKGTVEITLAHAEAPLTVQTFLRFVEEGRYDGTPFHRVVPNFVVQGGDFARRDGTGGPGFSIKTELTRIPFQRGVLGMASGGKDTEGSQFFIMHTRAPHLENRYTSFGWVTSGMDVVDQLLRGDRIIRMQRVPD